MDEKVSKEPQIDDWAVRRFGRFITADELIEKIERKIANMKLKNINTKLNK